MARVYSVNLWNLTDQPAVTTAYEGPVVPTDGNTYVLRDFVASIAYDPAHQTVGSVDIQVFLSTGGTSGVALALQAAVNSPDNSGLLIAEWQGRQVMLPGWFLAAAFVFNFGGAPKSVALVASGYQLTP